MFKLIALVGLKDGAPVDQLVADARVLLSQENAIRQFNVYRDAGESEHFSVAHAAFALLCDFDSAADWRRYVQGPVHAELSRQMAPWSTSAMVLQCHA